MEVFSFTISKVPAFQVSVFRFHTIAAPAKSPWRVLGQRPKRLVKTNAGGCSLSHSLHRWAVDCPYPTKTKGSSSSKDVKGLQNEPNGKRWKKYLEYS